MGEGLNVEGEIEAHYYKAGTLEINIEEEAKDAIIDETTENDLSNLTTIETVEELNKTNEPDTGAQLEEEIIYDVDTIIASGTLDVRKNDDTNTIFNGTVEVEEIQFVEQEIGE